MIFRIFNTIFIGFILAISFVVLLTSLGWVRLLVVKTGSMTPTLPVNSLLVIVPTKSVFNETKTASYKTGDIVSFKPAGEKALITHRIASVTTQNNSTIYQTKGDANESKDPWKITGSNIFGRVTFSFAGLGVAMSFLNSFLGLFLLVIIPATFIILHEVLVIQEELKKASEEKEFSLSKKTLAGPVLVILILILATPVYAIFSNSAFLTGNSLSTSEFFTIIPEQCSGMVFSSSPLIGTEGSDKLNGTSGNDLIFGFGGGDIINGGSGDDCIVGGNGNDIINGGSGNDVILGEGGKDEINGGSGNDKIFGGEGNDNLKGGSGTDGLFGEAGDDQLIGGSGSDVLDGDGEINVLNGGSGIDFCVNGTTKINCEL